MDFPIISRHLAVGPSPRPQPPLLSPFSPLTARATVLSASRSSISPTETSDHVLVGIRYGDERPSWSLFGVPLTALADLPVLLQQHPVQHEWSLPCMPPSLRR